MKVLVLVIVMVMIEVLVLVLVLVMVDDRGDKDAGASEGDKGLKVTFLLGVAVILVLFWNHLHQGQDF